MRGKYKRDKSARKAKKAEERKKRQDKRDAVEKLRQRNIEEKKPGTNLEGK